MINQANSVAGSNIVKKKKLREVQSITLRRLKEAVSYSAGPFGSTTQIIKGQMSSDSKPITKYTKDGHTILSAIRFDSPIEDSLQRELSDVTRYIKTRVGDGSTTTTQLASIVFDQLVKLDEDKFPPYKIIQSFQKVVKDLTKRIKLHQRDVTLDDVYKICMICTNNNERVSKIISGIYEEHGLDVFIDVGISTSEYDVLKSYDGLTLPVGFSDPVYVNKRAEVLPDADDIDPNLAKSNAGQCVIRDPRIYTFVDPIDTLEMSTFFNTIILNNIIKPYEAYSKTGNKEALKKVIPTVIMAPKMTLDLGQSVNRVVEFMLQFNNDLASKPPLLIVTNINGVDITTYSDMRALCGAKPIKKYIDPEIQKIDIENGNAPTLENVVDFCGSADQVVADTFKTTMINPSNMFEKYESDICKDRYDGKEFVLEQPLDEDGNLLPCEIDADIIHNKGDFVLDEKGERVLAQSYINQIAFLESELQTAREEGKDLDVIGEYKRRINSLKANMVDYYVGGITVTDRDSTRVLVEDAVKNVRSAAVNGVGNGTNFEGLRAAIELSDEVNSREDNLGYTPIEVQILEVIESAYRQISKELYSTVYYPDETILKEEKVKNLIEQSLEVGSPMNFKSLIFDGSVLCTIEQDIMVLEIMSKIITVIYTTNQSLIQDPINNVYVEAEDFDY